MNWVYAYPWVLLALLIIPIGAIWLFLPRFRRRKQATFMFTGIPLLALQRPSLKTYLVPLPDVLVLVAILLIILAIARPQSVEPEEVDVEGIDIYLALDMSGSMQAIDQTRAEINELRRMRRQPKNRFQSAVETLKEFTSTRHYDRIGMVVFAKDAFLQFPLTLDRRTIVQMLDQLALGDIDQNGTAIGNAIGRGVAGLKDSDARTKILILITDGDSNGGNISPRQATQIAKDLGIRIYPILVGKSGKTLVPRGKDPFSRTIVYQDTEFPVNPELLKEVAETTNGHYYRSQDPESLRKDLHSILDEFEKSRIRDTTNVDPAELYRPLVLWAIALLFMQFVLRNLLLRRFP